MELWALKITGVELSSTSYLGSWAVCLETGMTPELTVAIIETGMELAIRDYLEEGTTIRCESLTSIE